ncbi:MAG: nitrogen fixation/metabolism regulation signal transduction histidine kinase [Thalassomonas sp.]|jgi:nitrogen fixation/metabolism regulation signal transduction histidine kinase
MSLALKILVVIFLSGIKFMFAIPLSLIKYEFTFFQTLLFSVVGGVLSVFVFSFLSGKIYKIIEARRKNKVKKRSMKKALAIKTARKYGLFGIAFLTPIFLSIPIGTYLALYFFPEKKKTIPILITSVVAWSLVLSVALTAF